MLKNFGQLYLTQVPIIAIQIPVGPQQHGTSITNIKHCNFIAHYTAILTNVQYNLVVSCCCPKKFCGRYKALSAAADEGSNSKILVTSAQSN